MSADSAWIPSASRIVSNLKTAPRPFKPVPPSRTVVFRQHLPIDHEFRVFSEGLANHTLRDHGVCLAVTALLEQRREIYIFQFVVPPRDADEHVGEPCGF